MLHRPYIRQEVRQEVENRAPRNDKGQFLDANTHKPIEGQYDLGHKPGHEFWREAKSAEKEGLTQEQFNDRMNNPALYHIESPHENRSHSHEMPKAPKGDKQTMPKNEFLESIKADKATMERINQVSRNAAKSMNAPPSKKGGLDDGGRERGDTGPMSHGRESANKAGPAAPTASHSSPGEGHSSNGQGSSAGHGSVGAGSGGGHTSGGHGGH